MKKTSLLLIVPFVVALAGAAAPRAPLTYQIMDAGATGYDVSMINGRVQSFCIEPAAVVVSVRLQGGSADMAPVYSDDWSQHVHFLLKSGDTDTPPAPIAATLVKQDQEQVTLHPSGHDYDHTAVARFQLAPLPKGHYEVTVVVEELSRKVGPLWVVHGDETPEIVDWRLQHELEKANTWSDIKRIQLARVTNNPKNLAAWLGLAAGAEEFEDYAATKAYYERAILAAQQIGGAEMEGQVRVIQETLDLLPRYYADRDHLVIARETPGGLGTPTHIELRERQEPRPRATPNQ
jgi:hypothetical protein